MRRFPFSKLSSACVVLTILTLLPLPLAAKIVIAQGGASGYLMNNSLPAVALAVAGDAEIITFNVVLSADDQVLVLDSIDITDITNVADIFPDRAREDGRYYSFDFSLEDIRSLRLHDPAAINPPTLSSLFRIHTLEEELAFITALNRNYEKNNTVAIELRKPWLHHKEGKDLTRPLFSILQQFGYGETQNDAFIFSYDANELRRIRKEFLPRTGMTVQLVQLIDSNDGQETKTQEWGEWVSYNYDWMFSRSGIRALSSSVAAIGLPKEMLASPEGELLLADFTATAHQLGTMIFAFSVEKDELTRLPFISSFEEELEFFYFTADVDAILTSYCKDALLYLQNRATGQGGTPDSLQQETEAPLQPKSPADLQ